MDDFIKIVFTGHDRAVAQITSQWLCLRIQDQVRQNSNMDRGVAHGNYGCWRREDNFSSGMFGKTTHALVDGSLLIHILVTLSGPSRFKTQETGRGK